ncbi:cation diffusion facilitator family transporter [Sediminibacterium sp.]|uniref:cation diffusion facilitator family transporter n=1 Tax=Sediminibacterium sp. TaxID=1917865 RepID=UPI0027310CD9|nr:cation diffusion facilitator family transporter [Sediminibacterium sp.]MDP2421414.1 cation diffusion facilitator family transporter [Sediminibacterium sp.]
MTQNIAAISAGGKHNRSLKTVFFITFFYFVIEVVVGFMSNSLALLSDAAHMLTDVGGQGLALFAIWMSSRPRNEWKTYGYYRTEIFSALLNAVVLLFISGYILYEAWQRFSDPPAVAGIPMLVVAFCGLIINLISMKILRSGSRESINIKGAFLEVVSDMLSSVGVIIAGCIILITGWLYIDPIMSAAIGVFILPRTYTLLKESVNILLEAVPKDVDYNAVNNLFTATPGVISIHDLHIWTLTSGMYALSVHVMMGPQSTLNEASQLSRSLKELLATKFKINHTTIEIHIDKAEDVLNNI